jgi:hypothetical protein
VVQKESLIKFKYMTLEEMVDLPPDKQKSLFKRLNQERQKGKTCNYASVYGAGGAKIGEAAGIPTEEGFDLHKAYWDVNWSVKSLSGDQTIKYFYKLPNGDTTFKIYKGSDLIPGDTDSKKERRAKYNLANKAESLWLLNPVSKLWYSLRYPKDIFSTLNQGTGVYCFDLWIKKFTEKRSQLTGQMHDEVILTVKKGYREQCEKLLRESIAEVNEELNLNRELDIDCQFGNSYSEIH